ncbi:constitutive photomorphogenesis protein 10-like isoform X2 [Arachis duranensis]|uniref:Constitutive photomorphogenesis protein 10-like isoform X2 n=1 Tax=Arachis duranensis TaxID=130453 RepID=A0A9C6TER2_ARADU|nr:constitutive photomorphogenesis protein 10-like isoform X2 [Arachis duranensis]XP_052112392.1 constitutive photomorphogenesis protein 10-like isoform X2 [Arachis duranensis]
MMTSGRPSSSSAPTYSWAPTTSVSASSKRIHREMVELNNDPPPHCSATIIGPPETAYQSGIFFLDIIFLSDYPLNPPQDGWSPDNAVVPAIAHLYLENKAKHDLVAGEWTARFAK